jgi:hypothetical protein
MANNFLDSRIPDGCATVFIANYQNGSDPSDLQSVWIDGDIINAIQQLVIASPPVPVSGIRVYLAQYGDGTDGCDIQGHTPGGITVILTLTQENGGVHQDMPGFYFDYGNPCPPNCTGAIMRVGG